MALSPQVIAALTEQFLANYVPGVVRARLVFDEVTATPRDIYIDVAAGHDPEFVSRAVQVVMTDRFTMPIPPHHVHLRETDEPQLRTEAERDKRERPDLQHLDATSELDALLAARAEGTDDPGTFEFQRLRANAWYEIRDAYSAEIVESDPDPEGDAAAGIGEFEAQRTALLDGEPGVAMVAHPVIRDALVNGLLATLHELVLTPARADKRDLTFLQDTLFAEWLILAAARLGLPSRPFDDFPEDPYAVGPAVAAAIECPLPIAVTASVGRYDHATIEERRKAMRDAIVGLVMLEDAVMQLAFQDRYDPLAVEAMLFVAWLSLAAEHAGATQDRIAAAIPSEGEALDTLMERAAVALEQLCLEHGLVEPIDLDGLDNLDDPREEDNV